MIYDDISFTAAPDPVHPGRFRIVAHPPIGEKIEKHRRTGILQLKPDTDEADTGKAAGTPSVDHGGPGGGPSPVNLSAHPRVYLPTPDAIRTATRSIRAASLRAAHAAWIAGARERDRMKTYGTASGCSGRAGRMMVGHGVVGLGRGVERDEVSGLDGRGGAGEGGW